MAKVRESNTSRKKNIMRWGCCYTHRSKWTSEYKKETWATTIDAITSRTYFAEKWWFKNESYFLCLFLFVWTKKHQCGCTCSDSNDFLLLLLLLLEMGQLFYNGVEFVHKVCETKTEQEKKIKGINEHLSIEIDELKISIENYLCQHTLDNTHLQIPMCRNDDCHKQSFTEKCMQIINIAPKCALANWLIDTQTKE